MGEVKLNIVLSCKNYAFPFVVVDDAHLPGDLLLGYNFMRKAEIRQQPDRDTVTHQGNVYRLSYRRLALLSKKSVRDMLSFRL